MPLGLLGLVILPAPEEFRDVSSQARNSDDKVRITTRLREHMSSRNEKERS